MINRRRFICLSAVSVASIATKAQVNQRFHLCGAVAQKDAEGIYYDSNNLITQRDCDGGDTAQREGWYWFGTWVRSYMGDPYPESRTSSFEKVMSQLEIGQSGTFRRNPVKYTDPNDFTRDQTIPIVAAMGVKNDKLRLQRFYHELRRRNWFAQKSGDEMTTPIYRNFIARARDEKPNSLTDGASLRLATLARVAAARKLDDVGDDLNLIVILLLATLKFPNSGVNAAREYFSKNRPDNYGMFLGQYRSRWGTEWEGKRDPKFMTDKIDEGIKSGWKPDCPRVLGALRWYFRAESRNSPGLAELYAPIILKWFQ